MYRAFVNVCALQAADGAVGAIADGYLGHGVLALDEYRKEGQVFA